MCSPVVGTRRSVNAHRAPARRGPTTRAARGSRGVAIRAATLGTPRIMQVSLLLRPFRPEDEAVAVAAHGAFARENDTFLLGYTTACRGWKGSGRERIRAGTDIPSDKVLAAFLAAEVDGSLVGRASIRLGLNE
jgi:hypothetical protein